MTGMNETEEKSINSQHKVADSEKVKLFFPPDDEFQSDSESSYGNLDEDENGKGDVELSPKKPRPTRYIAFGIIAAVLSFVILTTALYSVLPTSSPATTTTSPNPLENSSTYLITSTPVSSTDYSLAESRLKAVAIPDVVGEWRNIATNFLRAEGFLVVSSREYSDTVEAGRVISQYPTAGELKYQGTTVALIISDGMVADTTPPTDEILEDPLNPFFIGAWQVVYTYNEGEASLIADGWVIQEHFYADGTAERLFIGSQGIPVRVEYRRWSADEERNLTVINFYDPGIRHTSQFLSGTRTDITIESQANDIVRLIRADASPLVGLWSLASTSNQDMLRHAQEGGFVNQRMLLHGDGTGTSLLTTTVDSHFEEFFWHTENGYLIFQNDNMESRRYSYEMSYPTLRLNQNGIVYGYQRLQVSEESIAGLFVDVQPSLVPAVTNRSRATAVSLLEEAGFVVNFESVYSYSVERGRIISQRPVAGTELELGSQVTIVVSDGPEPVTILSLRVTYDAGGGWPIPFAHYVYGALNERINFTIPTTTPQREGYRFVSWREQSGHTVIPGEATFVYIEREDAADINFVAQWELTDSVRFSDMNAAWEEVVDGCSVFVLSFLFQTADPFWNWEDSFANLMDTGIRLWDPSGNEVTIFAAGNISSGWQYSRRVMFEPDQERNFPFEVGQRYTWIAYVIIDGIRHESSVQSFVFQ